MLQPDIKVVGLSSLKIEKKQILCTIPAGIINEFYERSFYWTTIPGSIFLLKFLDEKKLKLPQNPNKIFLLSKTKRKGVIQAYRRGAYILLPLEVQNNNGMSLDKSQDLLESYIAWIHLKEGYYLAPVT